MIVLEQPLIVREPVVLQKWMHAEIVLEIALRMKMVLLPVAIMTIMLFSLIVQGFVLVAQI